MKRPIEKFGYKYKRTESDKIVYENWVRVLYLYFYKYSNKFEFVAVSNTIKIDDFEELQAIYETAKQIKEENSPNNILEKDLPFEQEANNKADIELQRKKVEEELRRYEENNKEYYEEFKKVGYRELEKEEISKKSCWQCSHFRGGYIGVGCWCSQEKCDYKENDDVLIPQ